MNSAVFSPDGARITSASNDQTVGLWDVKAGAVICEPLWGHSAWVRFVTFSPDGAEIASSLSDEKVQLWDAKTGTTIGEPLRGHTGAVRSVTFLNDTRIASVSSDETTRLWDHAPINRAENKPASQAFSSLAGPSNNFSSHPSNLLPPKSLRLAGDGWILGPNDELILWIPFGMRNQFPFFEHDEADLIRNIDFSKFACGEEWTKCYHKNIKEY